MTQDNALEPTHSDLELFEQLFQLVGMEYVRYEFKDGDEVLHLHTGAEKVGGYDGHYSNYYFENGKFQSVELRDH